METRSRLPRALCVLHSTRSTRSLSFIEAASTMQPSTHPTAPIPSPGRLLSGLVVGLFIAQSIAGLQVWQSNRQVLARAAAMLAEGYLTIPNAVIQGTLSDWGGAMAGGLFFTLSIGAGLTVATLLLACLAAFMPARRKGLHLLGLILLGLMFLRLNLDSLQPLASLYLLLVPLGVWRALHRHGRLEKKNQMPRTFLLTLLLPLILLTALWLPQNDNDLFIRIRDQILLGNPMGQAVNDYYYGNTLSPAEVFKPLHQKTLKSVARSDLQALPEAKKNRILSALAGQDYLPLAEGAPADVRVRMDGENIILSDDHGTMHSVDWKIFSAKPGEALSQFSQMIDGRQFFRSLTFYGLLIGFPLSLYLFTHGILAVLANPLAGPRWSPWVAGTCCLLLGTAAWWPVNAGRTAPIDKEMIGSALEAPDLPIRLAALRMIHDKRLEISAYPQYRSLLKEGGIAERYWFARALGVSRNKATYNDLLHLAEDPHPNVVCQAYYALGRRGRREAVPVLIDQLKQSRHWYAQWYGYRALKALGWRQTPSP
jgi:hypothetical protein